MKRNWFAFRLVEIFTVCVIWVAPVHAFMGDYISNEPEEMAVFALLKSSDIGYDSDGASGDSGDIDRKTFSLGLSRTIRPQVKAFGSLNYTYDGELGGGGNDLDGGYAVSAGGSYDFLDRETYSLQLYGQLNYIIEETFRHSGLDIDFDFEGYELLLGIMGTFRLHPRFNVYGAFQFVPLSRFTMESTSPNIDSLDLEREVVFGLKAGLLYDFQRWFVKAEAEIGSERAFSLLTGIKF